MKKQAIVIGLGQFGMATARALADRGVEVMAIDRREERVRLVANVVAEAVCFDASEEEALSATCPERRDVCVCAIGDEAREASIICTALLRQMGAPRVIARANDDLHARILLLVGAHRVVNPERDFGERFANQILHESITGELPLGENLVITEFAPPAAFQGKTLLELELPKRFAVTVVAVRRAEQSVILPRADLRVDAGDSLVVVAREGAVSKLFDRSV